MDKPFSPKTLADRWGCSRQHINNLIDRGYIKQWFTIGENRLNPETKKVHKGNIRIPACEVLRIEGSSSTEVHGALPGESPAKMESRSRNVTPFVPRTGDKPNATSRNT